MANNGIPPAGELARMLDLYAQIESHWHTQANYHGRKFVECVEIRNLARTKRKEIECLIFDEEETHDREVT